MSCVVRWVRRQSTSYHPESDRRSSTKRDLPLLPIPPHTTTTRPLLRPPVLRRPQPLAKCVTRSTYCCRSRCAHSIHDPPRASTTPASHLGVVRGSQQARCVTLSLYACLIATGLPSPGLPFMLTPPRLHSDVPFPTQLDRPPRCLPPNLDHPPPACMPRLPWPRRYPLSLPTLAPTAAWTPVRQAPSPQAAWTPPYPPTPSRSDPLAYPAVTPDPSVDPPRPAKKKVRTLPTTLGPAISAKSTTPSITTPRTLTAPC